MVPKIAIIGAGPGGLCVANILQQNSIPFMVYEGDKAAHERNQGGSLDLHPRSGQVAMREAGVWEGFVKHSRPESDVMKIVRHDGAVLWDGNTTNKFEVPEHLRKPEIDREKLNDILLEHVKPENISWGMHLNEVIADGAGKYDLHFRNGTTKSGFDLVIGADGAWSKVRKLVSDTLPHYSGISSLELWLEDADRVNPWLSEYVGAGSLFSFGQDRAIQIQRQGTGAIRTYASLRKPENFFKECGIDFSKPEEARKQYVEQFYGDAAADLKRVLCESNSKVIPRTLYMLPVGYKWEHRQGITLLGDAAHVMTPFAGVGVNAALADALDLAQRVVEASKDFSDASLDAAIQAYEASMFVRGEQYAQRTWKGLNSHFSAGGSEAFAKKHHDGFAALTAAK